VSFVGDAVKAICAGVSLAVLIAVMWWAVGAMLGFAYQGFKFVTG
jgi:hypothetical protein